MSFTEKLITNLVCATVSIAALASVFLSVQYAMTH